MKQVKTQVPVVLSGLSAKEAQRMDNSMNNSGGCKYSTKLNCHSTNECARCGWNPVVRERRIKQFIRERALEQQKRPERCPLRDISVMDQKEKFGMVLSCFSSRCEMTPEGTCRILAGVLDHWKAAAGIQTVPPEKVENSNELS